MKECWAKKLGNCSHEMSGEHIISDSILLEAVTVQGFSWCKNSPKRVSAASFKSKILCKRHNNELSPTDEEIKKFVFTFKSFFENSMAYDRNPDQFVQLPIRHTLSGNLIERWFCKTLINVATLNSGDADIPIDRVLPYLFEEEKFVHPFGLSFAVKIGHSISSQNDSILIEPLFHIEEAKHRLLIGGLFTFRGFRFVVLFPTRVNLIVNNTLPLSERSADWEGAQLNWHNAKITEVKQMYSIQNLFQVVTVEWQ